MVRGGAGVIATGAGTITTGNPLPRLRAWREVDPAPAQPGDNSRHSGRTDRWTIPTRSTNDEEISRAFPTRSDVWRRADEAGAGDRSSAGRRRTAAAGTGSGLYHQAQPARQSGPSRAYGRARPTRLKRAEQRLICSSSPAPCPDPCNDVALQYSAMPVFLPGRETGHGVLATRVRIKERSRQQAPCRPAVAARCRARHRPVVRNGTGCGHRRRIALRSTAGRRGDRYCQFLPCPPRTTDPQPVRQYLPQL